MVQLPNGIKPPRPTRRMMEKYGMQPDGTGNPPGDKPPRPNKQSGVTILDPQRHDEVTAWVEKYPEKAAAEIMRLREREGQNNGTD